MRAIDVARREECEVADRLALTLDVQPLLDLLELASNPWAVRVTVAVRQNQHLLALLPAVFGGKPTRTLRKENHADEENDCRYHLESPRDSECCWSADE